MRSRGARGTIETVCPATGELVGTYVVTRLDELTTMLADARRAAGAWRVTTPAERVALLQRLRTLIHDDLERIVDAVVAETGKVRCEALYADILPTLAILSWTIDHAAAVLGDEQRPTPALMFPGQSSYVQYAPMGVVAVFSPWNYPFQLAMVPVVTALAAGNCVLLKVSEVTPSMGPLIADLCRRAGFPEKVVQSVTGGPDVGRGLIEGGPDKIFFTGSAATGRAVMRAAAEQLIPVELELGGKDPMVVFADCNLERTVEGAVYGSLANSGQLCISVERLYVERDIYPRFCELVARRVNELRMGQGADADLGPVISPAQIDVIERHVDDALAHGARLLGGRSRDGSYLAPVVLADCTHDMLVMREETFGPVVALMPFDSEAQAVEFANDSPYGLAASVWTGDIERGRRVARELVCGAVAVNDVIKHIGNPELPFGGEKHSGFGRYHGPEGLRSFSRQTSVMVSRGGRAEPNWFPYNRRAYKAVKALLAMMFTGPNLVEKGRRLLGSLLGR